MSESTFPLKKVIPIIVVTWLLSLVTTLAIVYITPNIPPRTWHEIATFYSQDYEKGPINIFEEFSHPSSNLWRIRWGMTADSEDASFGFLVFHISVDPVSSRPVCQLGLDGVEDASAVEYFTGTGSFTLHVFFNACTWSLGIEAYY